MRGDKRDKVLVLVPGRSGPFLSKIASINELGPLLQTSKGRFMSKRSTPVSEGFTLGSHKTTPVGLPIADNTPEALAALLAANIRFRQEPWPAPFDTTTHKLHIGDARDLSWIPDESVHLVVTSPPYWTLKEYNQTRSEEHTSELQ